MGISSIEDCQNAEVRDLRAALAGDDPEHGSAYMYKLPGDYDWHVDFAPLPEGAFRIRALAAAPLPQQAADDGQLSTEIEYVYTGNCPGKRNFHIFPVLPAGRYGPCKVCGISYVDK